MKKVLETYQVYYTILFIAFEFIFILKQIFCLSFSEGLLTSLFLTEFQC